MKIRLKCKTCNKVFDYKEKEICPDCGAKVVKDEEGFIELRRKSAYAGSAAGFSIYLNNQPYGSVGNGETVRIPLPYGEYNVHVVCGMTRRCNDMVISLNGETPSSYIFCRLKTGFWVNKILLEMLTEKDI